MLSGLLLLPNTHLRTAGAGRAFMPVCLPEKACRVPFSDESAILAALICLEKIHSDATFRFDPDGF